MLTRLITGLVCLVLSTTVCSDCLLAQQPFARPLGPTPGAYMRLRMVRVFDESGFQQPVEAFRFLVPSDWQVQAWVRWRPEIVHCPANAIDSGGRAIAPDGSTGIEVFGPTVWQWVDDNQGRQIL